MSLLNDTLRQRTLDISGIENAILDLLVRVEDHQLKEMGLAKGTMKLVDTEEQDAILEHVGGLEPEIEAGGSCANVLRAASTLGVRASYSSAIGRDDSGRLFARGLELSRVESRLALLDGTTGTSVVLVSPDGERTMNTYLGVCRDYSPEHVPHDDIRRSKVFFTTGYIWDTPHQIEAIEDAIETARESDTRLAIDLADPFAVDRSKAHLRRHFDHGFDVVFANAEEARILTGLDPEAAVLELGKTVQVVAVKDGPRGAWLKDENEVLHVPAQPVEVVDTTGAGDCFAAGFLFGLIHELPLSTCGDIATRLAADTITHMGVKLSPGLVETIHGLPGVQAAIDRRTSAASKEVQA